MYKTQDKFIPTIKYRTIPGIKPNDTTKLLQIQYDAAIRHIYENGSALETFRLINDLKRRVQDATTERLGPTDHEP